MSTFRTTIRTASLAFFMILLGVAVCAAQDVVVSEYFNTGDPITEWTEIVVVKDNLNLVGWIVTDNNTEQNEAQGGVKFRDVPLWRNVRAGTIIVIWHRRGSSFTGRDIDPSDGYLEIGRDDNTIVDVAQLGVSAGGAMNIAAGGDFLQILNADSVHVHGVGHRSPTGPYYDATPRPKANADGSAPNNSSVSVVGSSLAAYDAGITSDSVQISAATAAITQGLPNRFAGAGMTSRNHLLWRQWREPSWSVTAPSLRLVGQTATDQTVEWSAVTDAYPADRVTGVMLLRDTAAFATFDASAIRDGASFNVGQNVSTARVVAVQPTEIGNRFTDAGVECGKRYWYRAYAYRYAADQRLPLTPDSSARGRQWVTGAWAESPVIDRPLPTKPVIRANATAICPGDTLTLITSSVGTYYEWTVDGQPVSVTGTTRITITQPGRYALRVTAEGGCQAVSDVFVVSALPAPVVDVTPGGVLTICTGDSVVLTATTPAGVYEWRRNGVVIAGATTSRYVARLAGDYQVRIGSASGCPGVSPVISIRIRDTRFHFEPASLSFPTLGACEGSASATVTLVNDGTAAITPSAFAMPAGFSLVSPAPGSVVVPAGGRITVTILFAPTGIGPAGGTATCTVQPCGTTATLALSGTRSEGLASIDVATVDYGLFLACSTEVIRGERRFTISNDGTAPLEIGVPDVQPPFYLMSFSPTTLAPGNTVSVTVQYRPITAAERNRTDIQPIRFPFRAGSCRDTLRATLQATTLTPRITIDEPAIDLGKVSPCDSVVTTTYTFRNDGQQPLTITAAGPTSLVVEGLPVTVLPGTDVVLTARLRLTGSGPIDETATVVVGPCDVPVVVRLLGVWPSWSASLSASSLTLPAVSLCLPAPSSTATIQLTVDNTVPSTVTAVDVTGPFTVDLQAGDVVDGGRTITVTYRPTASGTATGTLMLTLGPCGRRLECTLTGTAQTPGYTLVTSTLDFGQLLPGAVVQRSTTITNTGTEDLAIGVPAPVTAPFAFVGSSTPLPATLQPGGAIQVEWSYTYLGPDRTDAVSVVWSIGSASCPVTETLSLAGTTAPGETRPVRVGLSIPTTLRALAGDRTAIPVFFDTDSAMPLASELRFRLNYDPRVMMATSIVPVNGSPVTGGTAVELSPGLAEVRVNAQGLVPRAPLFLIGATTFDGAPSTSLVITDVVLDGADLSTQAGILTIDQDCAVNATGIGFGTTALTLRRAASTIDLDLHVASHDPTVVRIYDATGTLLATPLATSLEPGAYQVRIDARTYAGGAYFVVLEHGIRTVTVPVLLLR